MTVAITVPIVFSSGAGATASPHHYRTPVTVCSTTTTLGATTTAPDTTTTADTTTTVADTTTTAPDTTTTADTTTTLAGTTTSASDVSGITTPITDVTLGQQGVVQLGVTPGGNFVTLPVSAQAAAGQLPRTGSSSLPAVLGGLTLLVAGALALTTKRRRQLGVINPESKERP